MTYKLVFSILAIVIALSGVLCALFPVQMLATYDVQLSAMGNVVYRFWGVTLIGLGMITWFARKVNDAKVQAGFILSLLITTSLSTVMAVLGQFAGANASGWSVVATYGLLSVVLLVLLVRYSAAASNNSHS